MDTQTLNKLKENTIETMKQNFKKDGKLYPVVMVIDDKEQMHYIGTPYTNHEEKKQMMTFVKDYVKDKKAIAIFIINEAWVRKIKVEDHQKVMEEMKKSGKRISDYDDKQEVAILVFETKTSSTIFQFEIDRQKNELGKVISSPMSGGDFKNILCDIQTNTN